MWWTGVQVKGKIYNPRQLWLVTQAQGRKGWPYLDVIEEVMVPVAEKQGLGAASHCEGWMDSGDRL